MDASLTTDSVFALKQADGLFAEWQAELPPGPLRERIAWLAENHHAIDPASGLVYVAADADRATALFGVIETGGHWGIIGPYVAPAYRGVGHGGEMLETCLQMLPMCNDIIVLTPAGANWARDSLCARGFEPVTSHLADSAGDHRAFRCDRAAHAAVALAAIGEPRGGGAWAVTLHNDDTTTFDFVTTMLARVVDLQPEMAANYATLVHCRGSAVIRYCRTERGARKLTERIRRIAKFDNFPLNATYARR
jgi:ATP-dependent Clp protease adapter protein ClpS/GNAT superfamily N-acetyltransferase